MLRMLKHSNYLLMKVCNMEEIMLTEILIFICYVCLALACLEFVIILSISVIEKGNECN